MCGVHGFDTSVAQNALENACKGTLLHFPVRATQNVPSTITVRSRQGVRFAVITGISLIYPFAVMFVLISSGFQCDYTDNLR